MPTFALRSSLLLALCLPSLAQAQSDDQGRVAVGYYASFADDGVDLIPWQHLTHLCHAFLTTDDDGKLVTSDKMPSSELVKKGHARDVAVLLSIGGGKTATGLERVTASSKSIAAYTRQVVALVGKHDYDGVDLWWEFPRKKASRQGFVALVKSLRSELDRTAQANERDSPYLLTAVVAPSGFHGKWIDVGAIMARVDWLSVMTYDMSGPWSRYAGHHAPLLSSSNDPQRSWRSVYQSMNYWHKQRGVPKQKLVIGIPFFGRAMPVEEPFAELDPKKRSGHGTLTFSQIRNLIGDGWPAEWDDECRAPWLRSPKPKQSPKESEDSNSKRTKLLISYEDRNSVDQKAKWAAEEGYRGLYYWAIHQDRMPDGTHWLVRAADKAWPLAN